MLRKITLLTCLFASAASAAQPAWVLLRADREQGGLYLDPASYHANEANQAQASFLIRLQPPFRAVNGQLVRTIARSFSADCQAGILHGGTPAFYGTDNGSGAELNPLQNDARPTLLLPWTAFVAEMRYVLCHRNGGPTLHLPPGTLPP
ncbi:hypothetical protein SAMN02745857_02154 [Andreprevotia lacus DSM 23236]|jgi:hypothetical protein|uniref:Uncharacterized protein n=1 Tax=Andreprevotia lacus DSM 23236 TaxID=1121001 RepID=A0A1W1XN21_9NEIS|nr:hypothetical protein [Andreprevotia lacus]SMC25389.1 hypothetical protein SAMN02745857_02154 [Andreprevotia lacus DSM 23236]